MADAAAVEPCFADKVDVVVVSYNSALHLDACLSALEGRFATVVLDNASHDNSAVVARKYPVNLVESATNSGFAAGANRGAGLGSRPFILFLNPDAAVTADGVERLAGALADKPEAWAVAPSIVDST